MVSNNTITNITSQGVIVGIAFGAQNNGATQSISNNTINSLISTGTGGNVTGIQTGASPVTALDVNSNTIFGLSTTGASGQVIGIINSATNTINTFNNTIYNLTVSGVTPLNAGIAIFGTSGIHNIYSNKIYNLSASGAVTSLFSVNGIALQGGLTVNTYNNTISGLTAPIANSLNTIVGIQVNSTVASSTQRISYNSIYLNAISSGANFGTTGLFHTVSATATTAALDLRNNIIINESVANGTGITAAYRRSGVALNNYSTSSNRNLFFAGTPSASNLIMTDGTNFYQTLLAYQTAMVTRDLNSITGEGFAYGTPGSYFVSLTGSSLDFLKPVAAIVTQTESGASNIAGITTDYDAVIRAGNAGYLGAGTNPDMGAYEFAGTSPSPVITLNSVTPPASAQCATVNRLVSVNITTVSGTITGANLTFAYNGAIQTPIVMVNTVGTTWTATIPLSTPANAVVTWGVNATNSLPLTSSYTGATYSDEPLTGVIAVASATNTTVCSGGPSVLSANLARLGSVTIGNGTSTTGPTEELTAFCNRRATYRQQTVYTAADLTAAGLLAGSITAMGYTIASVGDAASTTNFTVRIGTTGLTALTDYVSSAGFTLCRPSATYNHVIGFNNIALSTPFVWDGASNIIVEVSHGGIDNFNNAQTFFTTTASNTVAFGFNGAVTGTLSNRRFNTTFTGNTAPAITSVTWMDGATPVGTGNPLTVNPTTTTTYAATISAAGCIFSPAPTVTVTTIALPATPTRLNSAQCGTQIPTASVTSTSGLTTPTFNWYDLASAGTVLQNSASTTFTSNVATTTTFHVAELNTLTGCESARVAVTVTVAIADAISATASVTPICIGSSVTLTAANTNGTPNQTYTYTWTNAIAGSGLTSATGTSAIVTPTIPGTYTYDLDGVDGACNAVTTVSVTVNANSTSSTTLVNCGPLLWNGISRPTSGTYTFTTANAIGCDSVATLILTVNSPSTSTASVTNCGPFLWNGISRTTSGTYTFTLPNGNAVGCDSVATLILTINQPTSSTTTINECGPYLWTNGTTYPSSGTFTQTLVNAAGCDSIATLDLTINVPTTGSESATACSTFNWPANSVTYTATGIYTAVLVNAVGCDSTVTLDLTITQPTTSSETASACSSYTWVANNTTYTTGGTYTATLTNTAGCDSVLTLTLTINGTVATATDNGNGTISANTGSSYVWINCATNTAIAGATTQLFTPTTNGDYAVVITNAAGCSDTSNCVTIGNIGIKEIAGEGVSIYPNPTASDVLINFPSSSASVEVMDATGKVIATSTILTGGKVTLEEYNRGVYYIRLNTGNGTSIHKVVKN